jgi:hypothetical protein
MKKEDEKPGEEGYTAPAFVSPEMGDSPPVGALIDNDAVCRDCMKAVEEVSMRRGFIDPIAAQEAKEKGYTCARCGKKIGTGS